MARIGMDPEAWIQASVENYQPINLTSNEIFGGSAEINNKKVYIYAHNLKYSQGFISSRGADDILTVMDKALEHRVPIVAFMASPGVSVEEGLKSGDAYTKVIAKNVELSGVIPQIAMIMGITMGAPAYSATLMDIVLFNKARSTLMVTGPGVIEKVIGQKTTLKDLGGALVHSKKTGIVDRVAANINEQINDLKKIINILPLNNLDNLERSPSKSPEASMVLPTSPRQAYDMHKFIDGLVDKEEFFELKKSYAPSIITAWCRINGDLFALVANQSTSGAGALDYESARKAARFIRLSDSFNIPLLNLIDVPGFMPGEAQEHNGLLRYGAQMCQSMQTTTPKFSIIIRRCYGAAAFLMMQTKSQGGDYVMALENSSIAVMGYDGAKTMIYPDDNKDRREEYYHNYEHPKNALSLGIIDEIIKPSEIREKLSRLLEKGKNKKYPTQALRKQLTLP